MYKRQVRDGILNHKKKLRPPPLEGMAVNLADRIAYLNPDLDDAARAGFLHLEDLPKDCIEILGDTNSRRINTMILDVIRMSQDRDWLYMSPEVSQATDKLRDFMFEAVYIDSPAKKEERKVQTIIDPVSYTHLDVYKRQAVDYIVNAKKIYVIGFRSSAPLAQFLVYYLSYIFENPQHVTHDTTDIYAQLVHADEHSVVIGMGFPRYSNQTVDGLRFAKKRGAKIITLTDNAISPLYSLADICILTKSDMNSLSLIHI